MEPKRVGPLVRPGARREHQPIDGDPLSIDAHTGDPVPPAAALRQGVAGDNPAAAPLQPPPQSIAHQPAIDAGAVADEDGAGSAHQRREPLAGLLVRDQFRLTDVRHAAIPPGLDRGQPGREVVRFGVVPRDAQRPDDLVSGLAGVVFSQMRQQFGVEPRCRLGNRKEHVTVVAVARRDDACSSRGGLAEIVAVDQGYLVPGAGELVGGAGAGDAAADHRDIGHGHLRSLI